jgi:clathrin heavy chain
LLESYLKADDCTNYLEVIQVASRADKYEDLTTYLNNARQTIREPVIESELIVCLAKTNKIDEDKKIVAVYDTVLKTTPINDQIDAGAKMDRTAISKNVR